MTPAHPQLDIEPPKRIQLRRTRGWRLPEGAVSVARPTKWGNPWVVCFDLDCKHEYCKPGALLAVFAYKHSIIWPVSSDPSVPDEFTIQRDLRGKDLACWCPPGLPCHADVLLELANRERP